MTAKEIKQLKTDLTFIMLGFFGLNSIFFVTMLGRFNQIDAELKEIKTLLKDKKN